MSDDDNKNPVNRKKAAAQKAVAKKGVLTTRKPPAKKKPIKTPAAKGVKAKRRKPGQPDALRRSNVEVDRETGLVTYVGENTPPISLEEAMERINMAKADPEVVGKITDFLNKDYRVALYDTLMLTCGNVTKTCQLMGFGIRMLYAAIASYPDFKSEFELMRGMALQGAEDECIRRAVEGVSKAVWHKGVEVGQEIVYSDQLLATLLRAHNKRYAKSQLEVTGADGGPIQSQVQIVLPDNSRNPDDGGETHDI